VEDFFGVEFGVKVGVGVGVMDLGVVGVLVFFIAK